MKCEYCKCTIHGDEVAHGIRYGGVDTYHEVFLPAKDSAWIIICSRCGEMLCKLIYAKFRNTTINPALRRTFTQTR